MKIGWSEGRKWTDIEIAISHKNMAFKLYEKTLVTYEKLKIKNIQGCYSELNQHVIALAISEL